MACLANPMEYEVNAITGLSFSLQVIHLKGYLCFLFKGQPSLTIKCILNVQ
uniref:Uncharacterized protein n=1 Tax=Rhizophora mucronata TaxID=61149 RepID=A0A2P2P1U3_RHIMU